MKRIVIDARMLGTTGHGIGNYVLQLAEGLAKLPLPFELFYLISPSLPKDSFLRGLPHAEVNISFLHPTEALSLPREISQLDPALYHTPSFSSLSRYPCPHIQTVHDLNHLYFGSLLQKVYYRTLLLPSLKKARQVLTVSESAKTEIAAWLRQNRQEQEITVVYNPIVASKNLGNDEAVLENLRIQKNNYFLCISNPKPHKNLDFLLESYRTAQAQKSDLPPLVLSTPGKSEGNIRFLDSVSDVAFGPIMRGAKAFFFPSLYEGFGRPPLEAALEGVNPIVSDIPVHREVLSGVKTTKFLSPRSAELWTQAFLQASQDPPIIVSSEEKSWIAETYSQEKLAQIMAEIYSRHLV